MIGLVLTACGGAGERAEGEVVCDHDEPVHHTEGPDLEQGRNARGCYCYRCGEPDGDGTIPPDEADYVECDGDYRIGIYQDVAELESIDRADFDLCCFTEGDAGFPMADYCAAWVDEQYPDE